MRALRYLISLPQAHVRLAPGQYSLGNVQDAAHVSQTFDMWWADGDHGDGDGVGLGASEGSAWLVPG